MIKVSRYRFSSMFYKIELVIIFLITIHSISVSGQSDNTLKNTLPESGKLVNDKPTGKGWTNLLASRDEWNFEDTYWQLNNNLLR